MSSFFDQTRYHQSNLLLNLNFQYIVELYQVVQKNPHGVSKEWGQWFQKFPIEEILNEQVPHWEDVRKQQRNRPLPFVQNNIKDQMIKSLAASGLVEAYRHWGHTLADLDPLSLTIIKTLPQLQLQYYSLKSDDDVWVCEFGLNQFLRVDKLLDHLHKIYCQKIGLEFKHIENPTESLWLQDQFEKREFHLSKTQQKACFDSLKKTEILEQFLNTKFSGVKRFSIEGNDSFIPALDYLLTVISGQKTRHLILGMAHRGRLSTMVQIFHQSFEDLFKDFQPHKKDPFFGSGDVKYHKGCNSHRMINGTPLDLTLLPNASHLESIVPVALGKTRFLQETEGEGDIDKRNQALCVLVHGDAAFVGQGVVAESLQLSRLEGYQVGGSLHVILNNQIGFTAMAEETRSTRYCSDLVKSIDCPIFHVNGDDMNSVLWAFDLALQYRYQFHKDVVIDLVGYRRHGHNEGDEPRYTQPKMYRAIDDKPRASVLYAYHLKEQQLITTEEEKTLKDSYHCTLQQAFSMSLEDLPEKHDEPKRPLSLVYTLEDLKDLALKIVTIPKNFHLNSKLKHIVKDRKEKIVEGQGLDWSTAETLALANILNQGHPVRLVGQDTKRGTFSQRHAEWIDTETDQRYMPLHNLCSVQGRFECINSLLSEAAALGFEYGYSLGIKGLTLWEAQFGDFVNGAQVIIDQYLSAGYSKWGQRSNLTVLLPHGYEGQGPEHSSARLERFLQLSAEKNWRIAFCSEPANFFHLLQSQVYQTQPLIALTPKSLLRLPSAVSLWDDFASTRGFKTVLGELKDPSQIKRVILCSGKVFYDLQHYRNVHSLHHTVLIRLEQLYPFPEEELIEALNPYLSVPWIWCQEEPENMGAWTFLRSQSKSIINGRLYYVGRPLRSAPATGFFERHVHEHHLLVEQAFTLNF